MKYFTILCIEALKYKTKTIWKKNKTKENSNNEKYLIVSCTIQSDKKKCRKN